jgi:hypothetical protein
MTVLDPALAAGDAGQVTGERQERPDPEVPERARRRTFTAQYKQKVLAAYEASGVTKIPCFGATMRPWATPAGTCCSRRHWVGARVDLDAIGAARK